MRQAALFVHRNGPLQYVLSLPPAALTAPPLLCFLHGYDEGAPTRLEEGVTRHGPLRTGSATHSQSTFAVVAPQLPTRGDLWDAHADDVLLIVRDVQREHGTNPDRTYLTGFSFGGNGVFDLALRQPDVWAALWAVDPTRVPRDAGLPVWLSVGEVARRARWQFIRALDLVDGTTEPAARRVYLDEGDDHVGCATRAYEDGRIYKWLLSHPRGKTRSRET